MTTKSKKQTKEKRVKEKKPAELKHSLSALAEKDPVETLNRAPLKSVKKPEEKKVSKPTRGQAFGALMKERKSMTIDQIIAEMAVRYPSSEKETIWATKYALVILTGCGALEDSSNGTIRMKKF